MRRAGPALWMAVGTFAVGVAGYAFVAITGHTLPADEAAALASVYLLINIIGPGLFFALEQETSRATSVQVARHGGVGPVLRDGLKLALCVLAVVLVALAAAAPLLTDRVLAGDWGLFAAVAMSVVTSAAVYLARGTLGGLRQFSWYAQTLIFEGVARLVPCVVLALVGGSHGVLYAFVFATGSAFGALAGIPGVRRGPARTDRPLTPSQAGGDVSGFGAMARGAGFLLGGTMLMQVVANLAPIVVTGRVAGDAVAAAFAAAFVLARVPLMLMAPVLPMLLPSLTTAVTAGDLAAVRARIRLIALVVAGIGLPGALLAYLIGADAVVVLFGAKVRLTGSVMAMLGVGTVAVMIALALQQGLVALDEHRAVVVAWAASAVALIGLLALPGDSVVIAATAQVIASLVAAAIMGVALRSKLRSWRPVSVATQAHDGRRVT